MKNEQYTQMDSKVGNLAKPVPQIWGSEAAPGPKKTHRFFGRPLQLNLNKLSDAGGSKDAVDLRSQKPTFESIWVHMLRDKEILCQEPIQIKNFSQFCGSEKRNGLKSSDSKRGVYMALKSPRGKRTKADVEQEFMQLAEEASSERHSNSAKLEMAEQIQQAEIKAAVSEITVEVVSKKLAELNVEISRTLSGLSEKMTGEVNLLRSLKEAVRLESKDLQKLHGIDVAATSIDQLIADYTEKKKSLEAETSKMREEWEKEKEENKREIAEAAELLKKNRTRENEDYEYKKTLERKKLQDHFDEEWRLKEKQNRESQEELEKSWKEREMALKIQEEEFSSLKKEVDQFPSRLIAECSKASKEALKEAEAKYNQEISHLKRDLVVEKQIGELKIKQLQDSLSNQQAQMSSLQAQLEEAKRQSQDIALKAIEGASGANALSHINKIAIEQAKNRLPN